MQTVTLGYPMWTAYNAVGFSKELPKHIVYQYTGFDPSTGKWDTPTKGVLLAIALIAQSTIGKKIANRVGANRLMRKATGNLLQLM